MPSGRAQFELCFRESVCEGRCGGWRRVMEHSLDRRNRLGKSMGSRRVLNVFEES